MTGRPCNRSTNRNTLELHMRSLATVWLALIMAIPLAHGKPRVWQSGQLTSHKTLPVPGRSLKHVHLYGVTSRGERYMVILDRPLLVNVNQDIRFSPDRKHLYILDSDSQPRKGAVLEKLSIAGGRH